MKRIIFSFSILLGILILISSCNKDEDYELVFDDANFETTDWTDATHAKGSDPDFDEVFDNNAVKRLDFVISEERWEAMLDDMENTYGSFGSGGGGGLLESDDKPIFVPGDVFYNGKQWYKVGLRFKGNSSLQSSWRSGILKLSFKMDFDEFEDEYPQIDNQRFYGFKKFSLKNNFDDDSQMREKVGADIFRSAGLASSHKPSCRCRRRRRLSGSRAFRRSTLRARQCCPGSHASVVTRPQRCPRRLGTCGFPSSLPAPGERWSASSRRRTMR